MRCAFATSACLASLLPGATAHAQRIEPALARLSVQRFGVPLSCAVGFSAGESTIVTSYAAIRGAERLDMFTSGNRSPGEPLVASHSVPRGAAVLAVDAPMLPALQFRQGPPPLSGLRAFGFTADGSATSTAVQLERKGDTLEAVGALPECATGGPIVDTAGFVAAVVKVGNQVLSAEALLPVLDEARTRIASRRVSRARDVAAGERHLYGAVTLRIERSSGVARITPLEGWHLPDDARDGLLPLDFAGPLGRYSVAVTVQDQVIGRETFELRPGVAVQLTLRLSSGGAGGGMKKAGFLGILGAAAAGGAALVLGGGGQHGGSPSGGAITVSVPRWHP